MASRTIYIIPSNNRPVVKSPITIQRPMVTQPNIIRKAPLLSPRSSIGGNMISRQTASILPTSNRPQQNFRCTKQVPSVPPMALKRPAPEPLTIDDVVDLISTSSNSHPAPPRKRERLTHLSMEEKLNRRKMKNRVAAQTARDRKKERVGKLEKALQLLMEENSKLRSDNRNLINENTKMRQEREKLHKEVQNRTHLRAPAVGTGICEVGRGGVEYRGEATIFQTNQTPTDLKQTALSADYFCDNDELQKIFDDLFNDPEDPIDFDRFCNEVIEEEFDSDKSRDTTPSPVETTFETQASTEYYEEPLPENVLCENFEGQQENVIEAYGTVAYAAISPSQQVPSPSMYTNSLSPVLSVKEENFYSEQKVNQMEQPMPVWDELQESITLIDDGTISFDDPFLLPYEDVLISSDNLWVETTIEA